MNGPRPILVVGGTGMLGRPVVERLLEERQEVRALVRESTRARQLLGPDVEYVEGDVRDPSSVARAVEGARAVYVSLRGRSLDEIEQVEVRGTAAIAAAAARSGVERLAYLSGAGIQDGPADLLPVRIKTAAERAIRKSGVRHTILRPSHFMESLDLFVRGRKAELLGRQPQRFHYICARDYAGQVARLLAMPEADASELTLLGPEPFTMEEALAVYVRLARPDLKLSRSPLPLVKLVAAVTRRAELQLATRLFEAFRKLPETGDRALADLLVGPATTRLDEWCRARREAA